MRWLASAGNALEGVALTSVLANASCAQPDTRLAGPCKIGPAPRRMLRLDGHSNVGCHAPDGSDSIIDALRKADAEHCRGRVQKPGPRSARRSPTERIFQS